jgi:hypothetical protein
MCWVLWVAFGWLKAGPKVHGGLELQFGVRCCYLVYKGTLPLVKYNKGDLDPFRVTYYSRLGI